MNETKKEERKLGLMRNNLFVTFPTEFTYALGWNKGNTVTTIPIPDIGDGKHSAFVVLNNNSCTPKDFLIKLKAEAYKSDPIKKEQFVREFADPDFKIVWHHNLVRRYLMSKKSNKAKNKFLTQKGYVNIKGQKKEWTYEPKNMSSEAKILSKLSEDHWLFLEFTQTLYAEKLARDRLRSIESEKEGLMKQIKDELKKSEK
ncbi:hypothetical protein HOG47_06685 [archaeon]|jgi:hypothetical protein|nr:hypothetical protein [archaeon]